MLTNFPHQNVFLQLLSTSISFSLYVSLYTSISLSLSFSLQVSLGFDRFHIDPPFCFLCAISIDFLPGEEGPLINMCVWAVHWKIAWLCPVRGWNIPWPWVSGIFGTKMFKLFFPKIGLLIFVCNNGGVANWARCTIGVRTLCIMWLPPSSWWNGEKMQTHKSCSNCRSRHAATFGCSAI